MLQFPLELQEAADGKFALQISPEEVGGKSWAAACCSQCVSCGGAIPVSHAHAGLRTDYALHLKHTSRKDQALFLEQIAENAHF